MELLARREFLSMPLAAGLEAQPLDKQVKELMQLVQKLRDAQIDTEQRISDLDSKFEWLSFSSPPIGSVVAYSGSWPPPKNDKEHWSEAELGWLLCDGREWSALELSLASQMKDEEQKAAATQLLRQLQAALPVVDGKIATKLPDYRGCFLRGLDEGIDKSVSGRDKGAKRGIGELQANTTALPSENGFSVVGNDVVPPIPFQYNLLNHSYVTKNDAPAPYVIKQPAGEVPILGLAGGDPETRPVNITVHWIVKFSDCRTTSA